MTPTELRKKKIKEHNVRILAKIDDPNEKFMLYSASDTWFPPRPIIEKDKKAIKKLYKLEDDK